MACFHLHGDDAGDTHLTPIVLPERDTLAGPARSLGEVPATTLGIGELIGRKPDVGVHPAPRRQFLVVLRGAMEILTTLDQRQRLGPGDVLLADDVGSKGHISRDVGDEPLMMLAVGIADGWELPGR